MASFPDFSLQTKIILKRYLPQLHARLKYLYYYLYGWRKEPSALTLLNGEFGTINERISIVRSVALIHSFVECHHTQEEIYQVITSIFQSKAALDAVVVEAGSCKGGSAAKISLACAMSGRELFVFDSFEGIPQNSEPHDRNIFGDIATFNKGDYAGSLEIVKKNISDYGNIDICNFVPGWFDDTMPSFNRQVAVAFLDVDLASSTKTCLKFLYPLLVPGGIIYSQDGHLPLVIDVLDDDSFWESEVGVKKPKMTGLRIDKLVRIHKD